MYKIECYVEDEKLGKAKRALAAVGARDVTDKALVNVKPYGKGGVKGEQQNGSLVSLAISQIQKLGKPLIDLDDVRKIVTNLGYSENSAHYVVKTGKIEKVLKPTAVAGQYKVVK
jgi:hypothetical protein